MNLRKLAQGQPCRLRIPGTCNFDPGTTVLAHIKRGWHGSLKPPDIIAVQSCNACHDVIDRRAKSEWTPEQIDGMILRALCEQLAWYVQEDMVHW